MTSFKVFMQKDWFNKGDIVDIGNPSRTVLVTSTPKRPWWEILLKILTLGLYKPNRYYYKVTLLTDDTD